MSVGVATTGDEGYETVVREGVTLPGGDAINNRLGLTSTDMSYENGGLKSNRQEHGFSMSDCLMLVPTEACQNI